MRKRFLVCFVLSMFFLFPFSTEARASSALIRAVYPNPPGSDTAEWILIENASNVLIPANSISVQDTEGSSHTFVLPQDLGVDEFVYLSASESGIALNNATDSVIAKLGSAVIHSTEPYTDAPEGQVWWVSDAGEWSWEESASFLQRVVEGDFLVVSEETEVDAEDAEETVLDVTPPEKDLQREKTPDQVTQHTTPEEQQAKRSYAAIAHTLLEQGSGAPAVSVENEVTFPEYDFDQEKKEFVAWKRQALLGSLLMVFGGVVLSVLGVPFWWRFLRWRF